VAAAAKDEVLRDPARWNKFETDGNENIVASENDLMHIVDVIGS
jgi:hypothetical protein